MLKILPSADGAPGLAVLQAPWKVRNEPNEGWLLPSGSKCGHFEGSTAKGFNARALKNANKDLDENEPELKRFEPYVLRHIALTRLGEAAATHSPWRGSLATAPLRSLSATFVLKQMRLNGHSSSWRMGTILGTVPKDGQKNRGNRFRGKELSGEPGRTRTCNPLIKSQLLYH